MWKFSLFIIKVVLGNTFFIFKNKINNNFYINMIVLKDNDF